MKKVLRWSVYILIALIVLLVVLIMSIDSVARSVAEKRLTAETGMQAHIGKFNLKLRDRSVRIEELQLINPPEFGGDTFVRIPELYVEVDPDALKQQNKLHLKKVRLNLAEIHVVENKDGKRNVDVFEKPEEGKQGEPAPSKTSTNQAQSQVEFGGIDRLEVSIDHVKYTNERYPVQNTDQHLGITNRVFSNLKTQNDLKVAGFLLAGQAGVNLMKQGKLSNPIDLLKKGASGGKEAGNMLKDIAAPFKKKK